MSDDNYAFHTSEDGVWRDSGYDSREEALADAMFQYEGDEEVRCIYTGRVVAVTLPRVGWADRAFGWLGVWLFDRLGESDELWAWPGQPGESLPKEAIAELDNELSSVFVAWLERHNLTSTWATIEDVRRHELAGNPAAESG